MDTYYMLKSTCDIGTTISRPITSRRLTLISESEEIKKDNEILIKRGCTPFISEIIEVKGCECKVIERVEYTKN